MNGAALCMLSHPFPAECLPACSTSSLPVPNALLLRSLVISVLAEKDWISFSLLGKQSITLAGNQVGDAEIQEPSASHSKTRLSQSTKALSLGLMVSAKTLTKQHFFFISFFSGASSLPLWHCAKGTLLSFLRERHPWVSLFLCLCFFLSPSEQESGGPDGWQPLHFSHKAKSVI